MKALFVIVFAICMISCEKYHKACYEIKNKHIGYSRYGSPHFYMYFKNDSASMEKEVDASSYWDNNIGETVCFNEQTTHNAFWAVTSIGVLLFIGIIVILVKLS